MISLSIHLIYKNIATSLFILTMNVDYHDSVTSVKITFLEVEKRFGEDLLFVPEKRQFLRINNV